MPGREICQTTPTPRAVLGTAAETPLTEFRKGFAFAAVGGLFSVSLQSLVGGAVMVDCEETESRHFPFF